MEVIDGPGGGGGGVTQYGTLSAVYTSSVSPLKVGEKRGIFFTEIHQ